MGNIFFHDMIKCDPYMLHKRSRKTNNETILSLRVKTYSVITIITRVILIKFNKLLAQVNECDSFDNS